MQNDDPWAIDPVGQPARVPEEAEPPTPASLEQALLALDHKSAPVFAVLDGAQFDNLPQELLLGDFVSRPLYLDRGDNNPEQIITAPQMVWLDERPEKPTGRGPQQAIPDLLALIANRPAAVFWQCPDGADALYRHLRGINMVRYPKGAIDDLEEAKSVVTGETRSPETPDTHILVLFRHADANVIAQISSTMDALETARFYGPTSRLLFSPDPDWANGCEWLQVDRPVDLPEARRGHLTLSLETIRRIDGVRLQRNRQRIAAYLRKVAPDQTRGLSDTKLDAMIARYMTEAHSYGVRSEAAMGRWCFLQVITEGRIGQHRELTEYVARPDGAKSADDRVRDLMSMAASGMVEK